MLYFLSVIALLAGPLIYAWGRRQPAAKQILDGLVLAAVAGIVCVHIVPEAFQVGGGLAALFLAIGLVFPVLLEKTFRGSLSTAHVFIVVLAAIGLLLHAIIDGIALLPDVAVRLGEDARTLPAESLSIFDNQLALGVILHRLPVGMAIWWTVRPSFGVAAAATTFVLLITATGFAWFFGAPIVELAKTDVLGWFQAFVAGSLVHVVAFGVSHHEEDGVLASANDWGFRAGILLGMFLIFTVPALH